MIGYREWAIHSFDIPWMIGDYNTKPHHWIRDKCAERRMGDYWDYIKDDNNWRFYFNNSSDAMWFYLTWV